MVEARGMWGRVIDLDCGEVERAVKGVGMSLWDSQPHVIDQGDGPIALTSLSFLGHSLIPLCPT